MRRTPAAILAAVAVTAGFLGLVLSPDVAGARVASTAKGTTMCFVSGNITASPALTLGSGKATTLTFSAGLQGCTGPNASKVMHANLTGKSTDISASCVGFENAFPALTAKVSYKTTSGSLATTKLAFSAGTLNYRAMPLSITYPKSGGKGVATGSFATKHATMMLNLSVPYTQWVATCQSSTGLATMTVVSTSSITL
jgi:hypothetical protein